MTKNLQYKIFTHVFLSILVFMLMSCGGSGSQSSSQPSSQDITQFKGVVQKGPLQIGSGILIERLDSLGNPTGESLETRIEKKDGSFRYDLPNRWKTDGKFPTIQITANGKYFDEALGKVSTKLVKLRSITENPENSSVNVLTDWVAERSKEFLKKNKNINIAIEDAKKELKAVFGIDHVQQLNINQLDKLKADSAQLLLLSGALMEVAEQKKVDPQVIIDQIAKDFSDDGKLTELGDDWFLQMQARVRENPKSTLNQYVKNLKEKLGVSSLSAEALPDVIVLASRPVANLLPELIVEPGDDVVLDGSASHDSGSIINFTWFRVDQQTSYFLNDKTPSFGETHTFLAPDLEAVLAAPNKEISFLYALVVTDIDKLTHTAVIKITVKVPSANEPPTAISQLSLVTPEDTPLNIILEGNDPDNGPDPLLFTRSTATLLPNGFLEETPDSSHLRFTPNQNYFMPSGGSPETFTFTVFDGEDDSAPATINITVTPVNDPPTAESQTLPIVTGGSIIETKINFVGDDIDGDNNNLVFEIMSLPASGFLQISGNDIGVGDIVGTTVDYIPNSISSPDADSFTFRVRDEGGLDSDIKMVNLTVANLAPIARGKTNKGAIASKPVTELFPVELTGLSSTDDDGTITTYQWKQIEIGPNDPTMNLIQSALGVVNFDAPKPTTDNASTGNYLVLKFRLTVTDDGAPPLQDSTTPADADPLADDVLVYVNARPIAKARARNRRVEGGTIELYGDQSSDIESAIQYKWEQISGSPVLTPTTFSNDPLATFVAPAVDTGSTKTLVFKLTVKDINGALAEDTISLTIADDVCARPIANAGVDRDVTSGNVITLNGSGTADYCGYENDNINYISSSSWTQFDDAGNLLESGDTGYIDLDFPTSGGRPVFTAPTVLSGKVSLYFSYTVKDIHSPPPRTSLPDAVKIDVYPTGFLTSPIKPTANAENIDIGASGFIDSLNLSGNDPDGDNAALIFEIAPGGAPDSTIGTLGASAFYYGSVFYTPVFSIAPDVPVAANTFSFIVIDQDGLKSDPAVVTLTPKTPPVGNLPPIALDKSLSLSATISIEILKFTNPEVLASDPDGDFFRVYEVSKDEINKTKFTLLQDSAGTYAKLRIDNKGGAAGSSGSFDYILVDEYGQKSNIATISVEFTP